MKSQQLNRDTSKLLNHKRQGASNKPIGQTLTKWLGCIILCISPIAYAAAPSNDLIDNAIEITGPDAVVSGTTIEATYDDVGFCGTSNTAPGVWYKTTGDGGQIVADTCSSGTSYDTKISIYTRDGGGALTCIAGNDDSFDCTNFRSKVTWDGDSGQEYHILVHGFGTATGNFDLNLSSEDITPPTITAPADVTVEATGNLTPVTLVMATATDNVDPDPTITNDNPGPFPIGETSVTWTATDASGNSANATQTVTILPCTDLTKLVCVYQSKKLVPFCESISPNGSGYVINFQFGISHVIPLTDDLNQIINRNCFIPITR